MLTVSERVLRYRLKPKALRESATCIVNPINLAHLTLTEILYSRDRQGGAATLTAVPCAIFLRKRLTDASLAEGAWAMGTPR